MAAPLRVAPGDGAPGFGTAVAGLTPRAFLSAAACGGHHRAGGYAPAPAVGKGWRFRVRGWPQCRVGRCRMAPAANALGWGAWGWLRCRYPQAPQPRTSATPFRFSRRPLPPACAARPTASRPLFAPAGSRTARIPSTGGFSNIPLSLDGRSQAIEYLKLSPVDGMRVLRARRSTQSAQHIKAHPLLDKHKTVVLVFMGDVSPMPPWMYNGCLAMVDCFFVARWRVSHPRYAGC